MRKLRTDYGAEDIYKLYCKNTGNPNKLSNKQYTAILKRFFKGVVDILIFGGFEFNMPNRLGNIRVKKSKIKIKLNKEGKLDKTRLSPDWKACRKLWAEMYPGKSWEEIVAIKDKPMVYHTNRHSDGYRHGWKWDKSTCIALNNTAYSFEMCRAADRKLAKALKDDTIVVDYSIF